MTSIKLNGKTYTTTDGRDLTKWAFEVYSKSSLKLAAAEDGSYLAYEGNLEPSNICLADVALESIENYLLSGTYFVCNYETYNIYDFVIGDDLEALAEVLEHYSDSDFFEGVKEEIMAVIEIKDNAPVCLYKGTAPEMLEQLKKEEA